jgi:hypothetical protein
VSQLRFTDDALQSVSMPHALRRCCECGRALILAQTCKSIRLSYRRSSPNAIVRRRGPTYGFRDRNGARRRTALKLDAGTPELMPVSFSDIQKRGDQRLRYVAQQ